jgi:hypothetical protein
MQSYFVMSIVFTEFRSYYMVCGTAQCLTPGECKDAQNSF